VCRRDWAARDYPGSVLLFGGQSIEQMLFVKIEVHEERTKAPKK
jgi:hypothetical protein